MPIADPLGRFVAPAGSFRHLPRVTPGRHLLGGRLLGAKQTVDETTEPVGLSNQLIRHLDLSSEEEIEDPLNLPVLTVGGFEV